MNHWSTHLLAEFFTAVSTARDERSAITVAMERATEVLESEVGAVLRDDQVELSWGVDRDRLAAELAAPLRPAVLDVAGVGELHIATAAFGADHRGALLVAREADPLSPEERQLLQAMAQSLGLALHNLALLAAERQLAAERLALLESLHEARHDSLTGLPTRVLFLEMLDKKVRGGAPTSVLFIDLDRFKAVNDTLGHRAGDELLGHVAARIRGCLRPDDVGARLGGDEFAVLLDDRTADEAVPVAWRLIGSLRRPYRIAGTEVHIGASIGVATYDGTCVDPGELLGNADAAMYRAKKDGAGRVVVFTPQMHGLTLNGDLQRALAHGEFSLRYQPIVDLATGATAAVEALLRWHHPGGDCVRPAAFLSTAEENGLIVDIGDWVLQTAGEQVAHWRRTMPGLALNVNVAARQLADPGFPTALDRMLTRCGLPAPALTVELAESLLMRDPQTAITRLSALRELGVQVAVDDFGVGCSSLSYLPRLPVDQIKIDQAFVRRPDPSPRDLSVVRAIADLAHALGMRTVVEGVETEAQATAVRRLGCDLAQGNHLCPPVPAEELFTPLAA